MRKKGIMLAYSILFALHSYQYVCSLHSFNLKQLGPILNNRKLEKEEQ